MKRCLRARLAAAGVAAGCSVCVLADWKAADEYERLIADVAEGEVETESSDVWVNTDAEFAKVGLGEYVLPLERLVSRSVNNLNVFEGTLSLTKSAAEEDAEVTWPEGLPEPLLWLDAGEKLSSTNSGDRAFVTAWHDRRETKSAAPFDYPWAVPMWLDPSKDGASGTYKQPEVKTDAAGRNSIYFQKYRSGVFMNIVKTSSTGYASSSDRHTFSGIRNIFAVHGVFDSQGYVLSGKGRFYHPGSTDGKSNDVIFSSSQDNTACANTIRVYLNGERVYQDVEKPIIGFQLMEMDFRGPNANCFSSFYSDNDIRPSASGGEAAHIGGDNLCEVVAFGKQLTAAQRAAVTKYLMAKWKLSSAEQVHTLNVGSRGTVKLGADLAATHSEIRLTGKGMVEAGFDDKELELGAMNEGFEGKVKLATGKRALLKDDEAAIEVGAGSSVKARIDLGGLRVSVGSAESDTLSVDAGEATDRAVPKMMIPEGYDCNTVTMREVPAGVKKLNVTGGKLVIKPLAADDAPAGRAAITNADFEAVQYPSGHGNLKNWTFTKSELVSSAWSMAWNRELSQTQTVDDTWASYSWLSDYNSPEGGYVGVFATGGTALSDSFAVPAEGIYDLSLFMFGPYSYGDASSRPLLRAQIVTADGATVYDLGHIKVFKDLGYVRYRLRTPKLAAGSYKVRIVNEPPVINKGSSFLIDDVRLERVNNEPKEWPIPNGGFEMIAYNTTTYMACISNENTTEGWTFTQQEWSGGKTTIPGVALISYGAFYDNSKTVNSSADWRFGNVQLSLIPNAGTASTTFTAPKAGRYYLRSAAAKFRAQIIGDALYYRDNANPTVAATVKVNDGEEISLGTIAPISMRMADYTWDKAFEVAAGDSITITVSNNSEKRVIAVVDDFVLVAEDDELGGRELVTDGFFDYDQFVNGKATGWTKYDERNGVTADGAVGTEAWAHWKSSANFKTTAAAGNYGSDMLPDGMDTLRHVYLIDYAYIAQSITFPKAGRYKLRYRVRGRSTELESPTYRYSTNCTMKAFLKAGSGEPVQIGEGVFAPYTNFVAHTEYFTVSDASQTYELQLGKVNDPLVSGQRDCGHCIDGISITYAGEAAAEELELPSDMVIDVAEGAKIELDFDGSEAIPVKKVRLGGKSRWGEISAATYPQYISGSGKFSTVAPGFKFVIR